ncbi:MAG: hypothetical protein FWH46_05845 [Methanimicrococcus sp.]|nr:hypothetical protein [Methanimicrococcus sp.]
MTTLKMATICDHINKITAHSDGEITHVVIESTCPKINKWGTEFDIPLANLMDMHETIFAEKTKNGALTPTCFVPTLIANVVWLENGMISKSLVKKMSPIKIDFDEE